MFLPCAWWHTKWSSLAIYAECQVACRSCLSALFLEHTGPHASASILCAAVPLAAPRGRGPPPSAAPLPSGRSAVTPQHDAASPCCTHQPGSSGTPGREAGRAARHAGPGGGRRDSVCASDGESRHCRCVYGSTNLNNCAGLGTCEQETLPSSQARQHSFSEKTWVLGRAGWQTCIPASDGASSLPERKKWHCLDR